MAVKPIKMAIPNALPGQTGFSKLKSSSCDNAELAGPVTGFLSFYHQIHALHSCNMGQDR